MDSFESGYRFHEDGMVEFICSKDIYPYVDDEHERVFVSGSFNGWLSTADSSWQLDKQKIKNKVYYSLIKNPQEVMIPGNCGFPEFRFFRISDTSFHMMDDPAERKNVFLDNRVILKEDEFQELEKINRNLKLFKYLEDFDENCPACRAEVSNFRLVPGTGCLFRGYHPFKKSRPDMDTEELRIKMVQKAMDLYGIKSDITLCGYELPSKFAGEELPPVMEKIEEKGNRFCVDLEYNLVYYHSDSASYSVVLHDIAHFILEHSGPYYIHCRLGSDRTGVTCAVFAALCGAAWNDIVKDFEATTRCGIGEFRDRKLLQYSLKKMLGYDPSSSKKLSEQMRKYFIKEEILKDKEITKLIEKLQYSPRKKETDFFNFDGIHICGKK